MAKQVLWNTIEINEPLFNFDDWQIYDEKAAFDS